MAPKPFPILFITASRIGDAVLSSGLLKKLHDEVPNARFTIVAGPVAAPLFKEVPNLDELIAIEKLPNHRHWFGLWKQMRDKRWGLVLDLRGSALARFLHAKRRAIHHKAPGHTHKVIEAARLLKLEDDPPPPYLFTTPETEERAMALIGEGGPILAMAPAANWVGKTWPTERFSLAAIRLLGPDGPMPDGRLLILGGPEDRIATEPLRRSIPRDKWIDLTGQADLLTIFAALKHARLFVGNDSGLMHIAAAAGAPTLGLFGPSDERLYGPWGLHTRWVRGPRDFETIKRGDPHLNSPVCHMLDLSVDAVVQAARELLADTEAGHG